MRRLDRAALSRWIFPALLAVVMLIPSTASAPAETITALAPVEVWADGFLNLRGIAVDADGRVFVADRQAGTVTRINLNRTRTVVARGLARPIGLAFDLTGHLLIAEERAGRVVRLEGNGRRTTPVVTGVKQPRWLAMSETGTLYISARRLARDIDPEPDDESAEPEMILALSPAGHLAVFADGFRNLQGLAVGGRLLHAATRGLRHTSRKDGVIFQIAILDDGSAGPRSQHGPADAFTTPVGLALDRLGALFLTARELSHSEDKDKSKRVIAKLRSDGHLTLFASRLKDPHGVAFDAEGNLFVADGHAGRVLRFRAPPAPVFTDLAEFTNQSTLIVHGSTEPQARVDLFLNDAATPITGTSNAAGAFELSAALRLKAKNALEAFATSPEDGLTSPPAEATVTHDGDKPDIDFRAPTLTCVRQTVPVEAQATDSGSDVASLTLSVGSETLVSLSPSPPASPVTATAAWNTTAVPDGPQTLMAIATDRAGNSRTRTQRLTVDNTPPETDITGGPSGELNATEATFTFKGTDTGIADCRTENLDFSWSLDDGKFTGFSTLTTVTVSSLTEGAHSFQVRARDLAGNVSTPARRDFTVRLGPTITAVDPPSGPVGTFVTITGTSLVASPTQVTFNGVPAVVRSSSATSLTTTVPIGATTGLLTVTTARGADSRSFNVPTTGDFTLTALPAQATTVQGGRVSYAVSLTTSGAFTGLVQLSATGLPAGVSATFSPPVLGPGQTGTLTLQTSPATALGLQSFTIAATGTIDGRVVGLQQTVALSVLPPGVTALTGRVLDTDTRPVQGVTFTLGGRTAQSDAAGNFLLLDLPAGADQFLFIDGSTAIPNRRFPTFPVLVTIQAGVLNVLPFTPYLHEQKAFNFTPIVPGQVTVVTDPAIPGFEMRIPADVTIIGWDGQPNTKVSVQRVPADRSPLPPPDPPLPSRSIYMFYFDKVGGGTPSRPVPLTVINDLGLTPGEKAELWYYDEGPTPSSSPDGPTMRWRLAGTGTVSADGQTISTDPGVGIPRFCCGAAQFAAAPPDTGPTPAGERGGDPVDLATGLFVLEKTDLMISGRVPLGVTRTYRSNSSTIGPFGAGTAQTLTELLQVPTPESVIYVQPGGTRIPFALMPDGTYANETIPSFRGARITLAGAPTLRLRDGSTRVFGQLAARVTPLTYQLTEIADRNGNRVRIVLDFTQQAPIALLDDAGRRLRIGQIQLTYGGPRLIESIQDPIGRQVQYEYDAATRLVAVTDPAGGITRYTYDARGNLTTITDPRGITFLTNEYGPSGRVIRQVQVDGGEWRFAYTLAGAEVSGPDCPGPTCPTVESLDTVAQGYAFLRGTVLATAVTDPRGNTTVNRFNNFGYLIERIDALGQATRFQRAEGTNLVLSTTDPLGRVTRFTYDANGNVTSITDPAGSIRTFAYEPTFNKVTSITDPLGNVASFQYDALGNLTARVDPLGNRTTITYTTFGQPGRTTDPLGNTTDFAYDAVGNLTMSTGPLGNITTRAYDAVSRLIGQTDPRGLATSFAYDPLNRLLRSTDPRAGTTGFTYDGNGNLLTVTDARGNSITHTYDAMDRRATRTDPVGASEAFVYDLSGNLTRRTDRKGQVSAFTYDPLNRLTGASYADGSSTSFTYDAAGRLISVGDFTGGTLTNAYDVLGRLLAQSTSLGTVGYQYDALGRRTQLDVPGAAPTTYSYDANSRLTQILQGTQTVAFLYDDAGRRTRLTLPNGVSTEYQYDVASRLTALIHRNVAGVLGNLTYQYDPAGNRTQVGGSFARTLLPSPVPSATHDAANRQLAFGDKQMAFDPNGNLTTLTDATQTTTLTWDARDRVIGVEQPGTLASFAYAFGRRLAKITNGTATHFLYDGMDITQQLTPEGTTSYLRSLAIDETLGLTNPDGAFFLTADALGSTLAVADTSGNAVTEYTYDTFGAVSATNPTFPNPFQFTGRENDGLAGLYYYRARYYHPQLHRFISEDPVRLGGINAYLYADDNPLTHLDPFGLLTLQLGVNVSFTTGSGITIGGFAGIAIDSQGNVGLYRGLSGGLGLGAGWFGGVSVAVSTGNTISDLGGPFGNASIAAAAGAGGSLDYFWGRGTRGQAVTGAGATLAVGAGASSTIGGSLTEVQPWFNIPAWLGGGGASNTGAMSGRK